MQHPAIAALLAQPLDAVGVSALSSVLDAVRERSVRVALTQSCSGGSNSSSAAPTPTAAAAAAAHRESSSSSLCKELLRRLVAVANDGTRSTAARVLCVECLYTLSCDASDAFCQVDLFAAVQQLNASFEALLDSSNSSSNKSGGDDDTDDDNDVLASSRAMLTVLLFRCSGYTRLRAGDVLRQLCGNDERRLVRLLRRVLLLLPAPHSHDDNGNKAHTAATTTTAATTLEWPLRVAVMRCLYELTTPVSYFAADDNEDISEVRTDAFLSRVAALRGVVVHRSHTLLDVLDDMTVQWRAATATAMATAGGDDDGGARGRLGALGDAAALATLACPSAAQVHELAQWSLLLRYTASMVQNLADYSDCFADVLAMQAVMHRGAQAFVATVAVPFVRAVLHTCEWSAATTTRNNDSSSSGTTASDELMQTALLVLRLTRFVLYPPRHTHGQQPSSLPPPPPQQQQQHSAATAQVQTALAALAQHVTRLEPLLRDSYVGMLTMVLTVDCLCNVDASASSSSSSTAFDALLHRIASDTQPLRPHTRCSAAEGFAVCFLRLESPFRGCDNATLARVHATFAVEEQALAADAEALTIVTELEANLQALQAVMMQLALCEMLSELRLVDYDAAATTTARGGGVSRLRVAGGSSHGSNKSSSSSTAAAAAPPRRHPPRYCCELTGKLMREPVVLRSGHRYEHDELLRVVADVGHVDPLTGEMFDEDDVAVDAALQQEIARYRVRLAAASSTAK